MIAQFQNRVAHLVETSTFKTTIMWVILANAVLLGLETWDAAMAWAGPLILALDQVCLAIFVIEIGLRLFAYQARFFKNGWNLFDFAIVAISLAPAMESLAVMRALRILRLLRLISVFPALRQVVESLVRALPGMTSVFILMGLIFYIGSVMATKLFGETFPEFFGSLALSAYSLFQIMTLESWSMGIVRPVMDVYPYAWLFFLPFILITTFAVLNVVVGLIVNAIQESHYDEEHERTDARHAELLERISALETLIKQSNTK